MPKLSTHDVRAAKETYWYFVNEREAVRVKKEIGLPKPWTNDPILQGYRFCNMRRMDDKVSRWLADNWYAPYFDHPDMLLAAAIARFINLPASLNTITKLVFEGEKIDWEKIKSTLRDYRDSGEGNTVFNGAYMVRGNDGMDKIECVIDYYVRPLQKYRKNLDTNSMERTWSTILESYGMGSFMAGQIVADLRWALQGNWVDRWHWAPVGPGSSRGMNRILTGDPGKGPLKQKDFEAKLQDLMDETREHITPELVHKLEAHDYQNTLCEADKYMRVYNKEGKRPKQKYPGV